jgi:hypothetical protein
MGAITGMAGFGLNPDGRQAAVSYILLKTVYPGAKPMQNSRFNIVAKYLLIAMPFVSALASGQDMSGSFDGWRQVDNANWQIENGEFVATEGNGHLVTEKSFQDFRITAEFYVDVPTANSGIYFHITDVNQIRDTTAYEANINDERPDMEKSTGALVNHMAPSEYIATAGKWNTYDVTIQGDHIVLILNGVTTVDTHNTTHPDAGPISLQHLAGEVRFRNVVIEEL